MVGLINAETTGSIASPPLDQTAGTDRSPAMAIWLAMVALAVLAMVVVGGATRLTGSGLSITQWKPISGAIPPLSTGAWLDLFHRYRATSQYRLLNQGMSLEGFKSIFWWEWAHRLLGRGVGILFAIPFAILYLCKKIPQRLVGRCLALFALGGLQGLAGWWMVTSGFENRFAVASERLAIHLGLALLLICALIWVALEALSGVAPMTGRQDRSWVWISRMFLSGVFLQCLLGALVAGNHAGLINNDWPLMAGRWIPNDYWQTDLWTTIAHGMAAVQFNHRLIAYGLVVLALVLAGKGAVEADRRLRNLALAIGALALTQLGLGIASLLATVPLALALAHQIVATLLFGLATVLAWAACRHMRYYDTC